MPYVRIWWKGRIHDYIRTGLANVDLLGGSMASEMGKPSLRWGVLTLITSRMLLSRVS